MARYSVVASGSNEASGVVEIKTTSDNIHLKLYDFIIGTDATPADQASTWNIERVTGSAAVGTARTSFPLDIDTALSNATAQINIGTSGGATTVGMIIPLNMRATFRWVAAPGGEIQNRASASTGLMLRSTGGTTTYGVKSTLSWEE